MGAAGTESVASDGPAEAPFALRGGTLWLFPFQVQNKRHTLMQTQAESHVPSPVSRAASKLRRQGGHGRAGESWCVSVRRDQGTRKVEGGTRAGSGAGAEDDEPGRCLERDREAAEFNLEVRLFPMRVHIP